MMMTTAYPFPAAVLASHVAMLGKTGSGKTSTAKLAVEQVVKEGARVCVLDPIKSDWWGVTSSADGKYPALPFVILGGPRGHVPLHSSAGAAIAGTVANASLPLSIIDMADFEPGGLQHFFNEFAPALLRQMKGVLYLVIEEAHLFAPKERGGVGNENLSVHWAKMLATAGRSKGIRLIVATQRTQALHNAVLGSCETLIAHRLSAPADQKPVTEWLKANADKNAAEQVTRSLSSLRTGTAWVCSGEAGIFQEAAFPRIQTYDNSATPTGDSAAKTIKTAPVNLDWLRGFIGEAVKEAEANDPKKLKEEIDALRKKLAAVSTNRPENGSGTAAFDAEAIKDVGYQRGLADGKKLGFDHGARNGQIQATAMLRTHLDRLNEVFAKLASGELSMAAIQAESPIDVQPQPSINTANASSKPQRAAVPLPKVEPSRHGDLKRSHQRVLDALGWWRKIGIDPVQRARAAVVAGYSPKASTFGVYIAELAKQGLVNTSAPGQISLTPEGGRLAHILKAASIGELRALARSMLGAAEARVFDVIYDAHPKALTRAAIAEAVGLSPKASTSGVYIARIASFGIIDTSQPGHVRAADWLFLRGTK